MQMLFGALLEWGCALPSSTNKAACGGAALLLLHANHQTTAAAWFQNKDLLLKLGKALNPVGQPVPGRTVGPVPKCRGKCRQNQHFLTGKFRSIKGLLMNYPRYDPGSEFLPLPSSQPAAGVWGQRAGKAQPSQEAGWWVGKAEQSGEKGDERLFLAPTELSLSPILQLPALFQGQAQITGTSL